VRCAANDRQALEQRCRYITRPALANECVQTNAAGQVVLKRNTAWRNGTTHLVMSSLEFMQCLAALVPRPRLHLIASLAKRWILGPHQGAIDHAHLHDYLNEFVFRFNRRHSRSRGMVFYRVLELAVRHAPVRYADIAAGHRPRKTPPMPPSSRGKPASLERAPADRPWRSG
jgi:hypothetical protein